LYCSLIYRLHPICDKNIKQYALVRIFSFGFGNISVAKEDKRFKSILKLPLISYPSEKPQNRKQS